MSNPTIYAYSYQSRGFIHKGGVFSLEEHEALSMGRVMTFVFEIEKDSYDQWRDDNYNLIQNKSKFINLLS